MMTLHCTQKLLQKLPEPPLDASNVSVRGLGNWYANLLRISRKQYILFTNEKTLFSFVIPEARKKVFDSIRHAFLWHLEENLEEIGVDKEIIQKITAEYQKIRISKTSNRSVLGCMRDIAYHYDHSIYDIEGLDKETLAEITNRINGIPHKIHNYFLPIESLQKLLQEEY